MTIVKKPWFIPALLTAIILAVGGLYVGSIIAKEVPLSEGDIRSQLENTYGGVVDQITLEKGFYEVAMTRDGASYLAEINAVTGTVQSLNLTSELPEVSKVLTEEEIRKIIAGKYTGEVERILVTNSDETPRYEAEIANEEKVTTLSIDAYTGEILSESVKETKVQNVLITKDQAVDIALEKFAGEVEDVTFTETSEGGHYLIEIDGENEEAIFQIHAITGKIMSTEWEN